MTITLKVLHWLCRLMLAGIFLYSGYFKIEAPLQFAAAIAGYRLVPENLIFPLATFLPWLEMILGYNFLIGWKIRLNSLAAAFLLLFFLVVLAITVGRGIEANCGCFSLDERISLKTIVRDSLILIPALYLAAESLIRKRLQKPAPAESAAKSQA
ncbi:MAG: DoxX family membrane protein [Acidobacteria bacterium]|nr:DoxX family membrane protein [Acidobacteriota bacterium]